MSELDTTSLDATLHAESPPAAGAAPSLGTDATVAAGAETTLRDPPPASLRATSVKKSAARSVVLPRKATTAGDESVQWHVDEHPRFESLQKLGEGGMGEVTLALDQDIKRKVAVKRLRGEVLDAAALLRFAEEVQVVGALEHPGIVPVHDVGIDEQGQHYAVLKFLEGETLEAIIDKLRAGEPEYERRFTMEYRARIFAKVLEAVGFAHSRGIIHRDLKPANIIVGPFGEVTVMDWGIAKRIRSPERAWPAQQADADAEPPAKGRDTRLIATRVGALVGTPLYMSPEQAAGKNDELDERSDLFSLCVVFYELLALEHPLARARTVAEVLVLLQTTEWDHLQLRLPALSKGVPCELLRVLQEGFYLDPSKRWKSVREMELRLQEVLDGRVPPACYITRSKRGAHEFMHWIDRHPYLYAPLYYGTLALLPLGALGLLWRALH